MMTFTILVPYGVIMLMIISLYCVMTFNFFYKYWQEIEAIGFADEKQEAPDCTVSIKGPQR